MIRAFHRWPGFVALVLVLILALSSAALSVFFGGRAAERTAGQRGSNCCHARGRDRDGIP